MVEENQTPEFKPEKIFVIADFDTLKALSDPIRLQILETLIRKPQTVKEIAKLLNTNPTRLYYHINQLETFKLIQVVSTRIVSGVIEKSYQAVAENFSLAHNLLSLQSAGEVDTKVDALLSSIFDKTRAEILDSVKAGIVYLGDNARYDKANVRIAAVSGRFKPEQAEAFMQKLDALIQEFDRLGNENAEESSAVDYSFLYSFYPVHTAKKDKDSE